MTLALVLERQRMILDPTLDEQQAHLEEALMQPEIRDTLAPTPVPPMATSPEPR